MRSWQLKPYQARMALIEAIERWLIEVDEIEVEVFW